MKKIDNLIAHNPEKGEWGDCHRVCFAMILGLEPEDVPHFFKEGDDESKREEQQQRVKDFLDSLGLVEVTILYQDEDYKVILQTQNVMSPGMAYILGGKSAAGCGHSVVCYQGEIFHDPTGSGIVDRMDDGYYWVTLFSPKPGHWRG